MPADVSKAKNFLLTTDFPLDKVVYLSSGSFTMSASSAGTWSVPHFLSFTPLCSGSWSLTPDFSVQYEYGTGTFPSDNVGISPFNQLLSLSDDIFGNFAGAGSVNVDIVWINNSSVPMTAYYRVFGFGPPDIPYRAAPTASGGDDFVFNTDYNYTKLYVNSAQSVVAGNAYTTQTSLGYVSQVSLWSRRSFDQKIVPYDTQNIQPSGYNFLVAINQNDLTVTTESPTLIDKSYVRLYLDDN